MKMKAWKTLFSRLFPDSLYVFIDVTWHIEVAQREEGMGSQREIKVSSDFVRKQKFKALSVCGWMWDVKNTYGSIDTRIILALLFENIKQVIYKFGHATTVVELNINSDI